MGNFIKQEAQHSIAHTKMNMVLEKHGLPVTQVCEEANRTFKWMSKTFSPRFNLALTAAFEYLTAMMCEIFFAEKKIFEASDPYVRALMAWHSIEEIEHRDVAFDVMCQVGNVPEYERKLALVIAVFHMFGLGLVRTNKLLKYDGYNRVQRFKLFMKGLAWFIGHKGVFLNQNKMFFSWFKQGFHPSIHPIISQYDVWIKVLAETNDPIQAGQAFWEAGK